MKHAIFKGVLPDDATPGNASAVDVVSDNRYARTYKRFLDLALCVLLIPLILPVVAVIALIVRRDGGPAFFGHERIGRDGVPFRCLKIRSMVPTAGARLQALLREDPKAAAQWKAERKLDNDPRVTWFGAFLRKSSLDELPQMWNVLRGEMSLVGPRPVPRDELDENYGRYKRIYQSMRPGVTGLWQVSGRNDVSYAERVRMDVDYANGISLWLDLTIVTRTVFAVLNSTGK
jgi:exopolysaccharide production protein ExoY